MLGRGQDTAARIGADEFALLIEEADGDAAVERYAQKIVEAFAEPFVLTSGPVVATASVGVATTGDSTDAGDLVRHADLALYAAKAAGKRQWRRYQPVLSAVIARRRELKAAIEDAVNGSAFTLAYQPIVVLATGEIAGFEALVRWPHPRWGMINPDQFISLAEETGYIVPLGSWVLRQAVSDLVAWQRHVPGRAALYASVNVSARQFREPGFVAGVRQVLSESGLAPSLLQLELTESVLLGRDDRIHAELTELKQLGVRLAIDDFGTGYSSLSYLRELPVDVLKIDKSFIDGIASSQGRLAFPHGDDRAFLLIPAGARGPAFLMLPNFRVIMKYNPAEAYALAIGYLADRLRGGAPFVQDWPRDERVLTLDERYELQQQLARHGFDIGTPDGLLGPRTRIAIRNFQASVGLVPDGFASSSVLDRLRQP